MTTARGWSLTLKTKSCQLEGYAAIKQSRLSSMQFSISFDLDMYGLRPVRFAMDRSIKIPDQPISLRNLGLVRQGVEGIIWNFLRLYFAFQGILDIFHL